MTRSLLAAVLAVSACAPARPELSPGERAAISDTVMVLTRAMFAAAERVDPEATFAAMSADSDAAHLNVGARFTRDSLLATYRGIFAGLQGQRLALQAPTVTVLARDAAVVSANGHFTATPKTGRMIESDAAWTFVWVNRGGRWTLLHSHQSLPSTVGQ